MSQSAVQSFTTEDSSKKKGQHPQLKRKLNATLTKSCNLRYTTTAAKKTYLVFQAYHALVGLKRFHWSWRRTG